MSAKAAGMLESAKTIGWDLGLSSIQALLLELNNPQNNVKAVHITGTNGKGSICAFLNSILMEAGYKVGRFTSPAVTSEYERYTINDEWITEESYNKCLDVLAYACENVIKQGFRHPSLFEIETALAFLYFEMSECDIMLIEVGMGGLLDATNVIDNPIICAFSSIGLDHTQWLGETVEEITKNKAGIIKPGCTIVSALQTDDCASVLKNNAKSNLCDIVFSKPVSNNIELGLKGDFQYQNAAVAKDCCLILRQNGFVIADEVIEMGLKKAKWPFRFEQISEYPQIILDGAHNYPAILQLKQALDHLESRQNLTFVLSVLADKDYNDMFKEIVPLADKIILVESLNSRALALNELYNAVLPYADTPPIKAIDFNDAANIALKEKNNIIVCFGTFTFLNDMKRAFEEILDI